MATKGVNQRNQIADPMKTKTGKTRLGPLGLAQLIKLLDSVSKPKEKAKIRKTIGIKFPKHKFEVIVSAAE